MRSSSSTLTLHDPDARRVRRRAARLTIEPTLIERALRIGLTALAGRGRERQRRRRASRVSSRLLAQTQVVNERAPRGLLRRRFARTFADGDGRLPRTLERFLGDRGALQGYVNELFDPAKRDSAIGRMRELLGRYSMATRRASRRCSTRRA